MNPLLCAGLGLAAQSSKDVWIPGRMAAKGLRHLGERTEEMIKEWDVSETSKSVALAANTGYTAML